MAKLESVLIIDDNANCIAFMSLALEAEGGFRVSSEMDPLRGAARIREQKPSLVVLDIKMPRLDGFGVLTQVRSEGNSVPMIMVSGSVRQQDIDHAYALGCNGYFEKPTSLAGYRSLANAVVAYWRCGEFSAA
ncbi:MAG: response regulator [Hyphomonadaceae bacterium]|nr:response regulator [Hyphomonadaceae bacterium]